MDPKFIFLYFILGFQSLTNPDTIKSKNLQSGFLMYKKIYAYGDSIKKLKQPGFINLDVFKAEDSLSKNHPYGYYNKVGKLMEEFKYNDAAFLYYMGRLRYRYYNSANPNYEASNDGALAASLSYEFGEPINMFLKVDVNNFIAILEKTVNWYDNHDYQFYSQKNNPDKYVEQSKNMKQMIQELENNKEKYQADWNKEREKFLINIDSSLNKISK